MIGKVVTGCVAILPYHTATQDRGSECRDFGFISRIVTALMLISSKHKCCHCSGAHWHTYNLKTNILILTPKKLQF